MNKYGLAFNNGDDLVCVEAEYFSLEDNFICFYRYDGHGIYTMVAIYDASTVAHCVQQREYTESEVLAQIESCR